MLQNHWLEIADDGVTRRRTPLFKTQSNVAKPLTWNRRRRRNSSSHTSIKNTIECCKITYLKLHIQNESITFDYFDKKNRVDDGVTRRRTPLFKTQSDVAKPLTWNRTFTMNQSHLIFAPIIIVLQICTIYLSHDEKIALLFQIETTN